MAENRKAATFLEQQKIFRKLIQPARSKNDPLPRLNKTEFDRLMNMWEAYTNHHAIFPASVTFSESMEEYMLALKPVGMDHGSPMSPQRLRRLLDRLHSMWQHEVTVEELSSEQRRIHTQRMVDFMCRDPTSFEMIDKFRAKYFPPEEIRMHMEKKRSTPNKPGTFIEQHYIFRRQYQKLSPKDPLPWAMTSDEIRAVGQMWEKFAEDRIQYVRDQHDFLNAVDMYAEAHGPVTQFSSPVSDMSLMRSCTVAHQIWDNAVKEKKIVRNPKEKQDLNKTVDRGSDDLAYMMMQAGAPSELVEHIKVATDDFAGNKRANSSKPRMGTKDDLPDMLNMPGIPPEFLEHIRRSGGDNDPDNEKFYYVQPWTVVDDGATQSNTNTKKEKAPTHILSQQKVPAKIPENRMASTFREQDNIFRSLFLPALVPGDPLPLMDTVGMHSVEKLWIDRFAECIEAWGHQKWLDSCTSYHMDYVEQQTALKNPVPPKQALENLEDFYRHAISLTRGIMPKWGDSKATAEDMEEVIPGFKTMKVGKHPASPQKNATTSSPATQSAPPQKKTTTSPPETQAAPQKKATTSPPTTQPGYPPTHPLFYLAQQSRGTFKYTMPPK